MADRKLSAGRLFLAVGAVWFALTILANAGLLGVGAFASFFGGTVFLPLIALFVGRAITRAQRTSPGRGDTRQKGSRTPPAIPGQAPAPTGRTVPMPAPRPAPPPRPVERRVERATERPKVERADQKVTAPETRAEPEPRVVEPVPLIEEGQRMTSAEMIEEAKRRYSRYE